MSKLLRAGFEAIITIVVTLGIIVGAFSAMFGFDGLMALSGVYYVGWATIILIAHLVLAGRRRHLRLSIGVATSVIVMAAHLVMYFTHNLATDINVVPVIMHDFGFALVALIVLNIVHLVVFRRRKPGLVTAPAAPVQSERVDDIPAPTESKAAQTA